jgi:hypothetical protein
MYELKIVALRLLLKNVGIFSSSAFDRATTQVSWGAHISYVLPSVHEYDSFVNQKTPLGRGVF